MSIKLDKQEIKNQLLLTVRKRNPDTIEQLISQIKQDNKHVSEEDLLNLLNELQDEKKLHFIEPLFPISARNYVFSSIASWYWIIIALSIFGVIFYFTIDISAFPLIYLRNVLGLIFVLYLPGYALVKTLYPISVPLRTRSITLDSIERIVLSLGLSIVATTLMGLGLYYTPIGLDSLPTIFSILIFTLLFATWGIYREYKERRALRKPRKSSVYFV